MNPLSKAFVILSTLLTVALSCFSVAVVGRQDNFKKERDEARSQLEGAKAQASTAKAKAAELETDIRAKQVELEQANQRLQSDLTSASAASAKAQADYNKAVADLEAANAALKIAVVTGDRANQERESYAKQYMETLTLLHKAGEEKVEAAARLAELSDQLRRTTNDLARFQEMSVASTKEAEEGKKVISKLESRLGDNKLSTATPVAATQTISGAITSVGQATNGVTLVQVNVGEKDQVAQGMEFTISRGANYLGTMVVTSVNTDAAVGRLTNTRGAIAKGDVVYIRGYNR